MAIVKCDTCGKNINRSPKKINKRNFCGRKCFMNHIGKKITLNCGACGKPVTRVQSQMGKNAFCNRACSAEFLSKKMAALNEKLNKTRMTPDVRAKLREQRLGKGKGGSYTKTYGRHTHRIIAEQMLGRKLEKGEVVHHMDENRRNNDPTNLMVFPSQKEHALWHQKFNRLFVKP